MLYSIVALLVVILDQAVKFWVTNNLLGYDVVTFIPGVISLVNVPNYGAAFGILSGGNARIGFIIVTVIFCLAVMVALATNFINGRFARWCLVMVAAGGFANCIDRVMYGYVVDMFKVELFDFFIFNVADIFITVFAILFAVAILFEKDSTAEDEDEEEEEELDEEEEDKPRRGLLSRFRHDDDDQEEEKPRRGKKAKYEDEYEEYRAKQRPARPAAPAGNRPAAAAPRTQSAQSRTAAPSRAPAQARNVDPFAEWEKANARVDAQRSGSFAAKAMGAQPQQRSNPQNPQATVPQQGGYRPPVQRPAQPARPAQPGYPQTSQSGYPQTAQPQAAPQQSPAQPAPRPQAKPADTGSDSEFNLDDILNEFK